MFDFVKSYKRSLQQLEWAWWEPVTAAHLYFKRKQPSYSLTRIVFHTTYNFGLKTQFIRLSKINARYRDIGSKHSVYTTSDLSAYTS